MQLWLLLLVQSGRSTTKSDSCDDIAEGTAYTAHA